MKGKTVCPFCSAAVREGWSGKIKWFVCGTMVSPSYTRHDQTAQCIESEIGALKDRIKQMEDRIKRLEAAGKRMCQMLDWHGWDSVGQKMWREAKEDKP